MDIGGRKLLVCNCENSLPLDGTALAKACGVASPPFVNTQLCRAQLDNFRAAVASGAPLLVACTQEAPRFNETAGAEGQQISVAYANIRERAGWSEQGAAARHRQAARREYGDQHPDA
jgi:hypothetical protein